MRLLLAVLLTLIAVNPLPAEAGRLSGSKSLNDKKYGYQIVKDFSRAGRASQRFEVRAGDCGEDTGWSDCDSDRERSEITLHKTWRYGRDQWIGFSVFLPENFRTSGRVKTTVGQIHQRGGPSDSAGGLKSIPPLMQMEMTGNTYSMCLHILSGPANNVRDTCKQFTLASLSSMRGGWTDILIHLDTSNGNETIEVFVNGQRKALHKNWIRFRPREYYFKYGIYRSFVSRHGGPMPTQILYIDEVRMGNSMKRVVVDENRPVD